MVRFERKPVRNINFLIFSFVKNKQNIIFSLLYFITYKHTFSESLFQNGFFKILVPLIFISLKRSFRKSIMFLTCQRATSKWKPSIITMDCVHRQAGCMEVRQMKSHYRSSTYWKLINYTHCCWNQHGETSHIEVQNRQRIFHKNNGQNNYWTSRSHPRPRFLFVIYIMNAAFHKKITTQ